MSSNESWNYAKAGVDIDAGNEAVQRIKPLVQGTMRPEVLSGIGGFAGLFALPGDKYRQPVLVSGCDGVGTKLKVAFALDKHDTVGIDCVAMCANDILVQGAEPLFFLDYLAVGNLVPEQVEQVVRGVAEGCRQAGCALLGGETAEMPGFYPSGEYDLAGFVVGAVEKDAIVDGSTIFPGDVVIGLGSSGLHSNGFSLVRRVLIDESGLDLNCPAGALKNTLGEELLTPTRIYVPSIINLLKHVTVKGMAHITGGGLTENVARVLPAGTKAVIEAGSWPVLSIFDLVQERGRVAEAEMIRTFNLGIGFVVIVSEEDVDRATELLTITGERVYTIGQIVAGNSTVEIEGSVFS
ncbi:MAG: phosphoribosylformylglycinamidine cyclo-ligase [bacterium]|jgi:phosphoribosylformylglycinamidine cyclo-ligase